MKRQEFTSEDWLRILTKNTIDAHEVQVIEGCSRRKAQEIVLGLMKAHRKGMPYICQTDDYLRRYRQTDRKSELRLIYGEPSRR